VNAEEPRHADELSTERLALARLRVSDAQEMQAVLAEPALIASPAGAHPPSMSSSSATEPRSPDRR
jgi:hypothetical protein